MKKLSFIFLSALIVGFFLLLNYLQPLRADDFGRAYSDVLVKGLDIYFRAIASNYIHWTGRISAQALVYLLLSKKYITESVFAINFINAISFYLFIVFSFKSVTLDKIKIISKDFLIYLFFFIFVFYQTGFIANVMWKTAAIQYFWGITLLTIFYYFSIIKKQQNILFAIFTGFFIGLYNEVFVGFSIVICFAYFLDKLLIKGSISKNIIYYFVSCVIGGVILVIAPGNYARFDSMSSDHNLSIFMNLINLISQILMTPVNTAVLLILVVIFIGLIFTNNGVKKSRAWIYTLACIATFFVLTPIAKTYELNQRVFLIYYAFFFIATFQQFYNHSSIFVEKLNNAFKSVRFVFLVLLLIQLYIMTSVYFTIYKFEVERNQQVAMCLQNNVENPTFPILPESVSATIFLDDITPDENSYNNRAFALFYGFKSVRGKPFM
ncbi:hypothetical protein FLM55_08915 [Francisella sp. Scap27]|uniref:DUF6056 family protein n=1 Tax=Francisella sp. Scap27 TaxID=2589986 RepID=UPI0015C09C1B|nr:DUF6056 family protein [Francisella sp. Scap27]QLE79844.1 hypothetical protein FLM55_08915 [Francisella sp. Scap27]